MRPRHLPLLPLIQRPPILHARIPSRPPSQRMQLRPKKANQRKTKSLQIHGTSNRKNRTHHNGRNLPIISRKIPIRFHQKMLRRTKRKSIKIPRTSQKNQPDNKAPMRRTLYRNTPRRLHQRTNRKHLRIRSNTSRARSPSNRRQNIQKSKPRAYSPRRNRRNSSSQVRRLQNRLPPHARHPRHKPKKRHQNVQRNILLAKLQTRPNKNIPMPSPKRSRNRKPILRRRIHPILKGTSRKTNNRNAKTHPTILPNHANHARNPTSLPRRRNQKHRHEKRYRRRNKKRSKDKNK